MFAVWPVDKNAVPSFGTLAGPHADPDRGSSNTALKPQGRSPAANTFGAHWSAFSAPTMTISGKFPMIAGRGAKLSWIEGELFRQIPEVEEILHAPVPVPQTNGRLKFLGEDGIDRIGSGFRCVKTRKEVWKIDDFGCRRDDS